jgi:hypothetical protein
MAKTIYTNRPSKGVTRMMVVESLLHLGPIADPSTYQYVGFGALEFIDFDLVHRRVGVSRMISIESKTGLFERCMANRPYNGIEILPGRATDQLTTIDWKQLSVVWLDYTQSMNREVIADIELLCRELMPGSVLIVTVNAHPNERLKERRSRLAVAVGEDRIPPKVSDNTLGDWGLASTQHTILTAIVNAALSGRTDGASWYPLLNVQYKDTLRMQLVAGIVSSPALDRAVDTCQFDDLDFVRKNQDAITIEVPYLTPKEARALNEQLPRAPRRRLKLPGVAQSEIEAYAAVYRWLELAT